MPFDAYYKCYRLRNASATPKCLLTVVERTYHTLEGPYALSRFIMETGYSQSVLRDCIGVAVSVRHLKRVKNNASAVGGTVHLVSPLQSVARNGTRK